MPFTLYRLSKHLIISYKNNQHTQGELGPLCDISVLETEDLLESIVLARCRRDKSKAPLYSLKLLAKTSALENVEKLQITKLMLKSYGCCAYSTFIRPHAVLWTPHQK